MFIDLKYKPTNEVTAEFYLEPAINFEKAADCIAAESSIGTWTETTTITKKILRDLGPKIFYLNKKDKTIKITYPVELFEARNIPQILSSLAGNVFGMKIVKNLRLLDIDFPRKFVKSFPGPKIGLDDLRRITRIKTVPLLGTIYKPKLGLTPKGMADLAYKVYSNGIDFSKDDENLASMSFNKFEDRVIKILEVVDKINKNRETKVVYAPNISAPFDHMIRRLEFVREHGGNCVMIDVLTVGWSTLQYINQNFRMIIHAHRAFHAAFTRNKRHGVSMLVLAKLARLAGVTNLHTGTIVGKMEGDREIIEIDNFLRSEWQGLKRVMPVASGGLHPALIPKLIDLLGKDIIINLGGGIHGHPSGSEAGARAIRQALDAYTKDIDLKEYAKTHKELKEALDKWS